MLERHVFLKMDLLILPPFSSQLCCIVCTFLGICAICLVFRKSACRFRQVKTKMYLHKSPFFKRSHDGPNGQVLMSVPGIIHGISINICFYSCVFPDSTLIFFLQILPPECEMVYKDGNFVQNEEVIEIGENHFRIFLNLEIQIFLRFFCHIAVKS